MGVSWILRRLIGASGAWELILTGRVIDATEAERLGIVSRSVPDDELMQTCLDVAAEIRANSPFGVWMTKEVLWANLEIPSLAAGIDIENRNQIHDVPHRGLPTGDAGLPGPPAGGVARPLTTTTRVGRGVPEGEGAPPPGGLAGGGAGRGRRTT